MALGTNMILLKYFNCTTQEQLADIIQPRTAGNKTLEDAEAWNIHSLPFMQMMFIPSTLCSLITLLLNPLILATIVVTERLRRETRHLLLANVMLADLLFLLSNTFISTCNILHLHLHRIVCSLMMAFSFTAYCSCVLTFTTMVVDTYLAVCFPLHYYSLLTPTKVKKIVAAIWIIASLFPILVFVLVQTMDDNPTEKQNVCLMLYLGPGIKTNGLMIGSCVYGLAFFAGCSLMIVGFYVRLYNMTRQSGIWLSRFSRARMTLLIHSVLLLLYVIPGLVFATENLMFQNNLIGLKVRLWISTMNSGVLMTLPRALAPVLYGLRYREVSHAVRSWFSGRGNCSRVNSSG